MLAQTPAVWFDGQLVIASPGYDDGGFCCRTEQEAWTYRFVPEADA